MATLSGTMSIYTQNLQIPGLEGIRSGCQLRKDNVDLIRPTSTLLTWRENFVLRAQMQGANEREEEEENAVESRVGASVEDEKQKHLDDMVSQVAQLRKDNAQILNNINHTTQHYLKVERENSVLRAQVMGLPTDCSPRRYARFHKLYLWIFDSCRPSPEILYCAGNFHVQSLDVSEPTHHGIR
nr:bZIP transcription factor 44 [Ipomoea batatas]